MRELDQAGSAQGVRSPKVVGDVEEGFGDGDMMDLEARVLYFCAVYFRMDILFSLGCDVEVKA